MTSKIALVLVALLAVQVSAFPFNWDVSAKLSQQFIKLAQNLAKQAQESQQTLRSKLSQGRQWLDNLANAGREWLDQARQDIQEKIQQYRDAIQATEAAVEQCWEEHGAEEQVIRQHFAEKSQACVDNNIGPVEEAAQKFQDDLNSYMAGNVELAKEFSNCGRNILCQTNVLKKMAQFEREQTIVLATDYFALNQAATLAAYDIRACEKTVFAETLDEYSAFQQTMDQCIRDKTEAASADATSTTTATEGTSTATEGTSTATEGTSTSTATEGTSTTTEGTSTTTEGTSTTTEATQIQARAVSKESEGAPF